MHLAHLPYFQPPLVQQFVPVTPPTPQAQAQGPTTLHQPFTPTPTTEPKAAYISPTYAPTLQQATIMPPSNHTAMYGPPPPVSPVYIVMPRMEPGSGRRGPHRRRTHETENCRKLRSAPASTRGFWQ